MHYEIVIAAITLCLAAIGNYIYEARREWIGEIDRGTKWAIIVRNIIAQTGALGIYIYLSHALKPLFS